MICHCMVYNTVVLACHMGLELWDHCCTRSTDIIGAGDKICVVNQSKSKQRNFLFLNSCGDSHTMLLSLAHPDGGETDQGLI